MSKMTMTYQTFYAIGKYANIYTQCGALQM